MLLFLLKQKKTKKRGTQHCLYIWTGEVVSAVVADAHLMIGVDIGIPVLGCSLCIHVFITYKCCAPISCGVCVVPLTVMTPWYTSIQLC